MDSKVTSDQPELLKESWAERMWRMFVIWPILSWQEWRCERAKAYLLRHDRDFRFKHVDREIVNRREKLYAEGASPSDPHISDRWSIEEELPPLAWPRKANHLF